MTSIKDLCYRYAEIKSEIDALEAEQSNIRIQIAKELDASGMEKFEVTNIGSFYYMSRKKYEYPKAITVLEQDLKTRKREYENSPKVKFTESKSLAFRELKE